MDKIKNTPINEIFYATKRENSEGVSFTNFYNNPEILIMTFGNKSDIYKVKIRPSQKGEVSKYWGWHRYKTKNKNSFFDQTEEYCMIWPSKKQVEMCFPYGCKAEEERGRGKLTNFVVEVIGKYEDIDKGEM